MKKDKIFQIKADLFKALAHPSRIKILEFLRDGEKCVCEFTENLDLEQSNVSQHLSILKRQDLITSRKEGLKVIYSVNREEIYDVLDRVEDIIVSQAEDTVSLLHKLGRVAAEK